MGTLVLLVALGETAYRLRASSKRHDFLAGRDRDTLVTEAAPAPLYYRLNSDQPGFTNAHGLRDAERRASKEQGVYRIAVIGDSVTMQGALPFEQLYVRQLQLVPEALSPRTKGIWCVVGMKSSGISAKSLRC